MLEASLNEIVKRHEVLRTRFINVEGRAEQVIAAALRLKIAIIDLSGCSEGEEEVVYIGREEAQRPFDLREMPLIRVKIVRMQEQEHILYVTICTIS